MRILAVGSMYPPHHLGGYELVWQGAMRAAGARGHDVRVLASDFRRSGVAGEEDPDVHRALEWHWSWERGDWVQRSAFDRLRAEWRNARRLRRHLRNFAPDVVTWWPMGGMSLGLVEQVRRGGVPSVPVVHDDWLVYGPRRDPWMRIWASRRRLGAMVGAVTRLPTRLEMEGWGRFLFNSAYTRQEARRHGIDPPDADVIHPGVHERFLEPAPERPWEWRLLYVGRVDRVKGVDTALAALAELPPEATLTIVGDADPGYRGELQEIASRAGFSERVKFETAVGAEALPDVYARADVVVFPVRWEEPWGLVPLEAMGIGRPVVATAGGGSAEFLRDGENALGIAADDPAGLARAVRRLGEDEALRARLREAGLSTAARYSAGEFERRIVDELEASAEP